MDNGPTFAKIGVYCEAILISLASWNILEDYIPIRIQVKLVAVEWITPQKIIPKLININDQKPVIPHSHYHGLLKAKVH